MDTTVFSNAYYSGQARGSFTSSLNAKYSNTACATSFTSYFGNVWDNYYYVKVNEPTVNFPAIKARWTTAKSNITTLIGTDLPAVNTSISNIIGNLTSTVDGITNPTYGLVAGLNCRVIGEDI